MVFKFLQTFPLGAKSLFFLLGLCGALSALALFLGWSQRAFLAGFVFSQIYALFFFYSAVFLFEGKKKTLGLALLFGKWLVLLLALMAVLWIWEGKPFLLGLSGLPAFWLSLAFEKLKKRRSAAIAQKA